MAIGFHRETAHLRLRPYVREDLAAMAAMHAKPEVARFLTWEPRDEETSRAALERNLVPSLHETGDVAVLAAFDRADGGFVGEFVLFLRSREHRGGEVGYILDPAYAGRGYATEGAREMLRIGFDECSLHRITGRLDARNQPSARVLEKLGMRREAQFVRNELVKGEWTDEVVYAVLADEWRAVSWDQA